MQGQHQPPSRILHGFRPPATTGGMLSKATVTAVEALVCCCAVHCASKRHALAAYTNKKGTANQNNVCLTKPQHAEYVWAQGSKLTSCCSNQRCIPAVASTSYAQQQCYQSLSTCTVTTAYTCELHTAVTNMPCFANQQPAQPHTKNLTTSSWEPHSSSTMQSVCLVGDNKTT